jgi:hypothetical protein
VGALAAAGHESILLRGPVLARALYAGGQRAYGDTDLLVAPRSLEPAGQVLERLGYRLVLDHRRHAGIAEPRAHEWRRGPGESVDLHWRVAGVAAPAERAWEVLAARTAPIEVGPAVTRALDNAGIALIVALHAAHHGTTTPKPLTDLERALDAFDDGIWRDAAQLARTLDATEAFAAGLRLVPAGLAKADELELATAMSPHRRLMASSQPPGALGLLRIIDARGARVRAVREALFPAPDLVRSAYPSARAGRGPLLLAYVTRLAERVRALPQVVSAVRSARRARP